LAGYTTDTHESEFSEATGRVKGTIRAGHVKLQNGGAVEDFIVS
jgi:hypothetical protein